MAAAMQNRSVLQHYNITLSEVQRFREKLQESLNLSEPHRNLSAGCEGCQGLLQDLAVNYANYYHG